MLVSGGYRSYCGGGGERESCCGEGGRVFGGDEH